MIERIRSGRDDRQSEGTPRAASPRRWLRPARRLGGRLVRWLARSGHRVQFTAALRPAVEALRGTVVDVGGGRTSPLAQSWPAEARRTRLDIVRDHQPDVHGDATLLPFRDGVADGVVFCEVMEHLSDPQAALDEIWRILRPGGRLLGSVPFLGQGLHADPHDYYRYTQSALVRHLSAFDEVSVMPHGCGDGVAWRMVYRGRVALMPLNPLLRQLSRRTDPVRPEGYVFTARRPLD